MEHLRTHASPVELHTLHDELRTFLTVRFAGKRAQLCVGRIDGDPKTEPLHEEFYELPRQARAVTERCIEIIEAGMNLYIGISLHSEPQRSYATALPSNQLWIDDAVIEGAELIETSAGNYQSWLKLDHEISADERSALQRAIRNETPGADTCSADAVHMARVPGGWNTKGGRSWRVRVARPAARVFSVAELRKLYPQAAQEARQAAQPGEWSHLPSGARLAASARFQALVKANEQLRAVVSGDGITIAGDSSRSAQRAAFVNQLVRCPKPFPHEEIRALALHFQCVLESNPKYFESDIDRLLFKYTPAAYSPEATRGAAQPPEPLHGGRRPEITTAELLDAYHLHADCGPHGIVLEWTVNEAAERLHVSTGTIKRREQEATEAGEIRREYGRVILSPVTWAIGSQCIAEPQTKATFDNVQGFQDTNPHNNVMEVDATEIVYKNTIGSQFDLAEQDAVNAPKTAVCNKERAHVESTHHPAEPADRELLSRVRSLARDIGESGWYLRDYGEWADPQLLAEAERLEALLPEAEPNEWAAALAWLESAEGKAVFAKATRTHVDPEMYARINAITNGSGPPRASGAQGGCVLSRAAGPPAAQQQAFFATGGSP
jgi:hypothetical protein